MKTIVQHINEKLRISRNDTKLIDNMQDFILYIKDVFDLESLSKDSFRKLKYIRNPRYVLSNSINENFDFNILSNVKIEKPLHCSKIGIYNQSKNITVYENTTNIDSECIIVFLINDNKLTEITLTERVKNLIISNLL